MTDEVSQLKDEPASRRADAASRSATVLRHVALGLTVSLAILPLNLAGSVITARLLGPAGRGELAAILLWPALLAFVGGLGVGEAVTFESARRPSRRATILLTGCTVAVSLAAVAMIVGWLLTPALLVQFPSEAIVAMRFALLGIPLALLTNVLTGVMVGASGIPEYNLVRLIVPIGTLIGLVGVLALHATTVLTVVGITLCAGGAAMIVAGAQALRRNWLWGTVDRSLIRPLLAYGSKTHLGNLAGVANERADLAVISLFLAPALLGNYSVAVSISGLVVLFGATLSVIAFPAVAGAEDTVASLRLLARFVRVTLAASLIGALVAIPLVPFVIPFVFGDRFLFASAPAMVLLVAAAILSTNRMLSSGLRSLNRPLASGVAELIAFVATVGGLLLLVPVLGIVGAAIASAFAYGVSGAVMVARLRDLGLGLRELLIPRGSDLTVILAVTRSAVWRGPQ